MDRWPRRSLVRIALVAAALAGPRARALALSEALETARAGDPALAAAVADERAGHAARNVAHAAWLQALTFRQRYTRIDAASVVLANGFLPLFPDPLVPGAPPPAAVDTDVCRLHPRAHRTRPLHGN